MKKLPLLLIVFSLIGLNISLAKAGQMFKPEIIGEGKIANIVQVQGSSANQVGNEKKPEIQGQSSTIVQTVAPPPNTYELRTSAKLSEDASTLTSGLIWNIYGSKPDQKGNLVDHYSGRSPELQLFVKPGVYLVTVAFGQVVSSKVIEIKDTAVEEVLILDAGGLRISGAVAGHELDNKDLKTWVYAGHINEDGERDLIYVIENGSAITRLPAGNYHIVNQYGNANAYVRADIRIDAGKVTDASVIHRAAKVSFRLVEAKGKSALANTEWAILTPGGDTVADDKGAVISQALAEGQYTVIAKYEGNIYTQQFDVKNGEDSEVEVVLGNQ